MEGSNYWGYGYKTQHSYPRSRLITWRRPEVKFGRNLVKKKQHKNYQDEDKKSAINKKLILRDEEPSALKVGCSLKWNMSTLGLDTQCFLSKINPLTSSAYSNFEF